MTLTKTPTKRPTSTHKKRTGQHHKQGHHYTKSYWPYLPIVAVIGLGFLFNGILNRSHHSVLGYATNVSNQVLLADTNVERAHNNEPSLKISPILTEAAQSKANDMAKRNYWSHVTPDGAQPWSFIERSGYQYESAGENLAYGFGTSDEVVAGWMQSTEHRDNILNASYQEVGFATANVANYQGKGPQTIVVALYAKPTAIAVTALVKGPPAQAAVNIATTTKPVSRLQTVVTSQPLQLALATLCGAAIALFILRHGRAWHKVLVKSEAFVLHHPLLDILLVGVIITGIILAQAAGSIL